MAVKYEFIFSHAMFSQLLHLLGLSIVCMQVIWCRLYLNEYAMMHDLYDPERPAWSWKPGNISQLGACVVSSTLPLRFSPQFRQVLLTGADMRYEGLYCSVVHRFISTTFWMSKVTLTITKPRPSFVGGNSTRTENGMVAASQVCDLIITSTNCLLSVHNTLLDVRTPLPTQQPQCVMGPRYYNIYR